jgi:Rrf2 family transcriptional regulator, iron-sulfur cluster assembly transcription factor
MEESYRMLSNTGEYALRAVIYLAEHEGEGPVRVEDVAAALAVPRNYLSKILHALVKRGILSSLRGPRGGFELAVPSTLVSLYDVVEPFGDLEARRTCLLGRHECSDAQPCAVHDRWRGVATEVALFFRETKLADVVEDGAKVGAILGH